MGQNNMAKSIVNFILFIIFIDIKFVMVSILIVSRCKYKDYFRFYKVYFHIFIVAVRGWLIHTQHETQALYTNVRTRTYAHATRQLFDHRPPITHNNLPYSILQRWSKKYSNEWSTTNRPPINIHGCLYSLPFNTILYYLITIGIVPSMTGHIVHCVCTTLHNIWPSVGKHPCQTLENTFINVGKHFCQRWIILLSNIG